MAATLKELAWERLISRLSEGNCTPFIGAGACAGVMPLASHIAQEWAMEHDYPFTDRSDLAGVMQWAAVKREERQFIKELLVKRHFRSALCPDFQELDEPHRVLAGFPVKIYLTTNFDDFMFRALQHRNRSPVTAICPWYTRDIREIEEANQVFEQPRGYAPDSDNPIVYHLHGSKSVPKSLVLTEDDYVDFLVRVVQDQGSRTSHNQGGELLPPIIRRALGSQMLLFIGYSLRDWTFRVLFQGLLESVRPGNQLSHVSVQLPPLPDDASEELRATVQDRFSTYLYERSKIDVFWGSARDFCRELRQRWEPRSDGK